MVHNKSTGYRWRQIAALSLQSWGLPVRVRRERASGPDALGDLQGLTNWALMTRSEQQRNLSVGVDEARTVADAENKAYYAVLWSREGRDVGEGFAVTDLRTMAALIRATATYDGGEG